MYLGSMSRDVHNCTHWLLRPRKTPTLPHPPHWDTCTRALLVSKERRHLFVTSWLFPFFVFPIRFKPTPIFRIVQHRNEDDIQHRIPPEPDQRLAVGALLGHGQQQQFHPCCLQRPGPRGRDFFLFSLGM